MEEKEKIDFKFEWTGKDYEKIAPNVIETAKKLLELNLIKVEPELNEDGNVVIRHTGVCKKAGMIDSISSGIIDENIYKYTFNNKPTVTLNCICKGRNESKWNYCNMSVCPILVAGYLYYLKYRDDSEKQVVEEFIKDATDTDVYARNYNELKKLELDKEIEEFIAPLALPSIKTLRGNFIGEEGVDTETVINKIAKYLFRIGKIETPKYTNISFKSLISKGITLDKKHLYVVQEIGEGIELANVFLKNSKVATKKQGDNKEDISLEEALKVLKNGRKDRYIIINATPLELKKFFMLDAKLPYIFDQTIYFKDYNDEELLKFFEEELPEYHKNKIKADFKKNFLSYLDRNRRYFPFKNKDLSIFLAGYTARKDELLLPKDQYSEESLQDLCDNLVGMENIKSQLQQLNKLFTLKKKLHKQGIEISNLNLHMMFLGNPGTGKTTVARMIAKILFDLGYIKENKVIEASRQDFVAEYIGQTSVKTTIMVEKAMGGVLFIDEAYSLKLGRTDTFGDEAISTLIKLMEDYKDDLVVIFAGYTKEMQEFIHANSGIKSRIGYTIEFTDYSEEELYEILKLKVNKIGFEIDENIIPNIMEILKFGKHKKDFGNGRFVDNLLTSMLKKHSINYKKENIFIIGEQDIPTIDELMGETSGQRDPDKIEELFDGIVGMDKIKEQVIQLGKYIKFQEELSKISAKRLPDMRLHMLFNGDAGTGKTTMARKITQMLYNLGVIRINKLVEVDRKDLVAEWIGQTAPKTQKVIEEALGGVLFIDEAYSLTPIDNARDFGQEAIATIIKAMEDNRDDLVVIFAGYTKEMKRFVNSNSGIASRIGYNFEFENYKDAELYKIFEVKCKEYDLIIKPDVKEKVMEVFKYFSSVENFGNGRFVDKILQEILVKHSMNENLLKNINVLMLEDVPTIKEMVEKTFNNRGNLVIPSDVSIEDRRKIAIHELGHAIIHYIYQGETNLKVITVIPEGSGLLGYVLHTIPKSKVIWTKRDYLDEIEELIAGRAAEEVFLGADKVSSGCWNDLEKVANIIDRNLKQDGMSETLGLISAKNIKPSLEMQQKLDQEKKATLDSCYENVKNVIKTNKKMFDKVLDVLMEKGTLTGEEFVELVKRQ